MNLGQLLTEVARETGKNASTLDASTRARFVAAINRHYRRLASSPGLQHLRDTTVTFASVADQALYQIANVAKVSRIFDTTNRRILLPMTVAQYRALQPDASSQTGTPTFWVWRTYTGAGASQTFDLFLWPTPSAVITYSADVTALLTDLALDADTPIFPVDFHDLLFMGAAMDEYRHLDDTRYTVVADEYRRREAQFKYWLHESDAGSTPLGLDGTLRPSTLGPWFEAGS